MPVPLLHSPLLAATEPFLLLRLLDIVILLSGETVETTQYTGHFFILSIAALMCRLNCDDGVLYSPPPYAG